MGHYTSVEFGAEQRDDYGRTVYWVTGFTAEGKRGLIGSITRLPKATFPEPTFMVNDFRHTRTKPAEVFNVHSLTEAKGHFEGSVRG